MKTTQCISGCLDDVTFSHNGASGPELKTTLCFVQFAGSGMGAKLLSTIADLFVLLTFFIGVCVLLIAVY